MILIIGSEDEYHAAFMYDALSARGEEVCYFDTRRIGIDFVGSLFPSEGALKGKFFLNGRNVFLNKIKSVYWRSSYGINIHPASALEEDTHVAFMQEREFSSLIDSTFRMLDCLWVNSQNAINMHKAKGFQLKLMAKNNIRIPRTLITNDREELEEFIKSSSADLIFKPVLGGALTEKLNLPSLSEERLKLLINSPVQFQELLEGVDVRVYGVGEKLFAAEILANSLDFRDDHQAKILPVEIPDKVKQDCLKIMEMFDLKFTGIDIRHNKKTDEYVFIEANPSPMFTFFQEKTGFPISDSLVELLISGT
jgi:glutathione synthase/RimK-type ligase-like ATP-grasp enzyme